jgi:hypothetical protein
MINEQISFTSGYSVWALLIGIDEYLIEGNLRGCVNDVEAMQIFLINQLNVPEDHICILINKDATRQKILNTFEEFLINNPAIQFGDQILFQYSGHGSRMRDPLGIEPDGYYETLVPYDSRMPNVYNIPDKTIAALLERLAAKKGDRITVILDSCHSGSGTREIEIEGEKVALSREVPADERIPPADLDANLLSGTATRGAGSSGWSNPNISYVLLAGCRNRETSKEHYAKTEDKEGVWHGAFTYFTLSALKNISPNTTYAELHEQVATQVNGIYREQMPQCEGDRDRLIFGGVRVERDPFIPVKQVINNMVSLGAGLVHGLRPGTKLALYPPNVRTRNALPSTPLATVTVSQVSATSAQAELDGTVESIPVHSKGIIIEQVYTGLRQTVSLKAAEGEENNKAIARLHQIIESATPDKKPSPYLLVLDDTNQQADLQVIAEEGKLNIYDHKGDLLVESEDIKEQGQNSPVAILYALENIARYRILLNLTNQENNSRLAGLVKVHLCRYVESPEGSQTEELAEGVVGDGGEITLYYDPSNEKRNLYVVKVINNSSLPIYPHIFFIGADYSISRLYPDGGQEYQLTSQKSLTAGLRNVGGRPLEVYLPDKPRWDSSRDYIKVIITTVPSDLAALEQGGINAPPPNRERRRATNSPLDGLLDTILYEPGKRHGCPYQTSNQEDWSTVAVPLTIVREYQTNALDVPAGRISLSDGLTLVKPAGFHGQVTVTTWSQATRGTEGDSSLEPPPGLAGHSDLFQPLRRSGTRSIGSSGLVIAFDVDEASRRSITLANPLRLELPTIPGEEVTDILPVAFDGEDYLLAGYSTNNNNAVELVHLPSAVVPTDSQGQPTKRGIGRNIRLFVYKKMGRHTTLTGLHRAELVDGKVVYSDVQPKQFQPGDTVALFVHGFTSDTGWMIKEVAQFLRQEVVPYHHLLTWDYEAFGINVQDNGEYLANALKQDCGFGADDEITVHIYAHGSGCLVSRWAIELSGGYQFIDRLVMAGPPNNGSTLANVGRGIVYLTTTLINQFSVIPPVGIAKSLFEQIHQQAVGFADLEVNSATVQQLNKLAEPSNFPYLVLAGKNVPDEKQQKRLHRIAQKVLGQSLDHIFGEENDIAVGMSSMRAVRGGGYPQLKVETLPCDHFHYFLISQGREAIKQWMNLNI